MSFRRSDGPADRAEYERLLDAARAGQPPSPGADPLAHLLAAAAAPAGPGELPGEEQALAAFRAARANPPVAPARVPRRRRLRVGVAAWAAGLTAVATAGVAVAAVKLDRPGVPVPPPASTSAGSASAGSPDGAGTAGANPGPSARSADPSPTDGPSAPVPSAAPDPTRPGGPDRPPTVGKLTGQCRAYRAKPVPERVEALETAGFADLVAAAGGADQVDAYCARLVSESASQPSPNANSSRSSQAAPAGTPARRPGRPAVD
ncbi:hypothetical protein ABZ570_00260 [Micromonospora sp. NPDC007271]|uniref:hypothetical protein n=1 Tax=Micromonospora sp. NPDC007271 TaxID=3154587 RepID=UPI0033EFAEC3